MTHLSYSECASHIIQLFHVVSSHNLERKGMNALRINALNLSDNFFIIYGLARHAVRSGNTSELSHRLKA